ncbi:MAG: hypothetical protein ABIY55_22620 [Kofleriaceae bacterium]
MTRSTRWRPAIHACGMGLVLVALAACTGALANPPPAGSEDDNATGSSEHGSSERESPGAGSAEHATPGDPESGSASSAAATAGSAAEDPDAGAAAAGSATVRPSKKARLARARAKAAAAAAAAAAAGSDVTPSVTPSTARAVPSSTTPAATPAVALAITPSATPLPTRARHTTALLGAMATLVGQFAEPAQLAAWANKLDHGAPLDGYIDELLGSARFAREVMPSLLFAAFVNVRNYYALPSSFVLRHQGSGPLYLRAPCAADDAVTVRPWWDLHTDVKVCPDSYRPTKWTLAPGEHNYRTAMALSCDSQVGSPELETNPLCGCGPNLIRCMRDDDQYNEFNRSFMDEIKRTTAYVVEHDLPMASLFTGNATFRDRNVELYYRRQKIGTLELARVKHELADLDAWPDGGKWAPRAELQPGQHAGVLTAPQILHWLPDRRQRQRGYYEVMWCNLRNSFGATTHKVLELNAAGNNFFVHESWKQLAHTELCMNCHARLDYGSQFFLGYPDSRASTHYDPALVAIGTGPLYGRDLHDLRGEAPLTPLGFANLATDQPDFNSCMTNHFVSYVLGDHATNDDLHAIETAVGQGHTFKAAMKVALERYAQRWRDEARPAATPSAPSLPPPASGLPPPTLRTPPVTIVLRQAVAPAPPGGVPVPAALRGKLDQHCTECHDEAAYSDSADSSDLPFNFKRDALPRALLVSMADHVAFGMMPKDEVLDPPAREAFVTLLIDTLWTDPAARAEAAGYYLGRSRGLPAHQLDNALATIDHLARAPSGIAWGALERGIWSDQATITPGFLALTGLEAVRACTRAAEAPGKPLEACLTRAASLDVLSRWPAQSSSPAP